MPLDMKQALTETRDACIRMQVSLAAVNKHVNDLLFMVEHPVLALYSGKDASAVVAKLATAVGAFVDNFEDFADATKPLAGGDVDE